MEFYRRIKISFGEEAYLGLSNRSHRMHIARIRSSSHDLRIERGRYCRNYTDPTSRICRFCCHNSDDTMTIFANLPFCEDFIVETEEHAITECPAYHHLRITLSDNLKSLIMLNEYGAIMTSHHMKEFGKYLLECHRLRNPKAKDSQRSDRTPSIED